MTLITPEFGFGDLRAATELPTSSPAAGKTDSTRVGVAPVPEPACARLGSVTAAAKPMDATKRVTMRARRLTGQVAE